MLGHELLGSRSRQLPEDREAHFVFRPVVPQKIRGGCEHNVERDAVVSTAILRQTNGGKRERLRKRGHLKCGTVFHALSPLASVDSGVSHGDPASSRLQIVVVRFVVDVESLYIGLILIIEVDPIRYAFVDCFFTAFLAGVLQTAEEPLMKEAFRADRQRLVTHLRIRVREETTEPLKSKRAFEQFVKEHEKAVGVVIEKALEFWQRKVLRENDETFADGSDSVAREK